MTNSPKQKGFTIVELLIVIVVIGILAAITIVAYNGIQDRARASSVSSALSQAAKKLAVYQVDNPDLYPTDKAALDALGIKDTNDVTYQYTRTSGTPNTYCLTATNGTTSYKISSSANAPSAGGCAGHGVGGQAPIRNLAINPSAATGVNYWSTNTANSSTSRDAAETRTGSLTTGSIRTTVAVAGSASTQLWDGTTTPLVPVTPGDTITISAWVKASVAGRTLNITDRWRNNALTEPVPANVGPNITTSTTWTRVNFTTTVPAGANYSHISFYFNGQVGDSWWLDDVMVTKDGNVYNYADGASPNWVWDGTTSLSTSTGPAL
jgi:prepilin-type N-terminal cleavage/methylation domain-containing protein